MTLSTRSEADLSECEAALERAVQSGTKVDARVGDPELDRPENGPNWDDRRQVRAEVLMRLLLEAREPAEPTPRSIDLQGVRIVGALNLEDATLPCRLVLLDCYFDQAVTLDGASAPSIHLAGSHLPALRARQLVTRGDLELSNGFTANGPVELAGAHIGGELNCDGGHFNNPGDCALDVEGLTVLHMFGRRAVVHGEVRLIGAHIGQLEFDGGHFTNPGGAAIRGDGLTVDRSILLRDGFVAEGEVRLLNAQVGAQLDCNDGHFNNPHATALSADALTVAQDMFCREGFTADGEVRILGAHIGGQLDCQRGHFSNPTGCALNADGLRVEQDMFCRRGFVAEGEVRLVAAHVGRLELNGGRFSNAGATALSADGLVVDHDMLCTEDFAAQGDVRLVRGRVDAYYDNPATAPASIWLDGFVYGSIDPPTPVADRLTWLTRNGSGYSPQIYDQLAAVYRRWGYENEARTVAIAKQRQRRGRLKLPGKLWSLVLDWTVGYGYRTAKAWLWLLGLVAAGTIVFLLAGSGHFRFSGAEKDPFRSFFFSLDLLLPVIAFHQRDLWTAQDFLAQLLVFLFSAAGWVLTTAVVLSLSGILRRE